MDYYSILGITKGATDAEIKKAYRSLAHKYHPDKNPGDNSAEEQFKKIAIAYETLSSPEKRNKYDSQQSQTRQTPPSSSNFDDWVNQFSHNQFRERSNHRARQSQGKPHTPVSTEHLDITIKHTIKLEEAILGKKIELSYTRKKIEYTGSSGTIIKFTKTDEEKEITIQLNLRKVYLAIKKEGDLHTAKVRVSKMGHEDVSIRQNIWGDTEQIPIFGDLYVEISIEIPEKVKLEENSIIHTVEIPLYKVLAKGEKIRIETILDKKYDADIDAPKILTGLQFVLKEEGILNDKNILGNYIIKFDILSPDLSILSKEEKEQFLSILRNI